jgi:transcriptional regulator with XRE-family HTH domain
VHSNAPKGAWTDANRTRKSLGVTAQQIVKYENGENGVGAGRLPQLAAALQVPLDYFFPKSDWEMSAYQELPRHVALALEVISSHVETQTDQGLQIPDLLAKLATPKAASKTSAPQNEPRPRADRYAAPALPRGGGEVVEVKLRFADESVRIFQSPDFWLSRPGGMPTIEFLAADW